MGKWFQQKDTITQDDLASGFRSLLVDGVCGQLMILLTGGAFLVAMALELGASNLQIGLLAAIGPLSQIMQIPAIFIVESWKNRKAVTVVFATIGRLFLLASAIVALVFSGDLALDAFLACFAIYFALSAISGCGFNSWIRNFIPEEKFGSFMGRRMSLATWFVAVATILAAFGMDALRARFENPMLPYSILFIFAAICGLIGAQALARIPEPKAPPSQTQSLWNILTRPLKDQNFRRLLFFTASWNFTIVMAGAFFAVYMLNRLGLDISTVILLSVLSQITNAVFFKLWGNIADRYSNKSVLQVASPLFLLIIVLYPLTTMPDRYVLSIPILIFIHLVGGVATAGFTLCVANIALKLAPREEATSYLATNAFFGGIAATVGPLVGGAVGHFFDGKQLSLRLTWLDNSTIDPNQFDVPALIVSGLDFVFIAAAIAGLYALHRLSLVQEVGSVEEKQIREELVTSMRQTFVTVSNVAGVRRMTYFPYSMLQKTARTAAKSVSHLRRPRLSSPPDPSKRDSI